MKKIEFLTDAQKAADRLHAELIGRVIGREGMKPNDGVVISRDHAEALMLQFYALAFGLRRFLAHAEGLGISPEAVQQVVQMADHAAGVKVAEDRAMQIPSSEKKA